MQTERELLKGVVGKAPIVFVDVQGGCIQWIDSDGIIVVVKDYDVDGYGDEDMCLDRNGERCFAAIWGDEERTRENQRLLDDVASESK